MTPICVIAEIGIAHNGSLTQALDLIDGVALSGAKVAKFQMFDADRLKRPAIKQYQLSPTAMLKCRDYCEIKGIEFLCTPFDIEAIWWLKDEAKVKRLKISSGKLWDKAFIRAAEETRLPLIISTGMATEAEIDRAMQWCSYTQDITLLHCVSGYPVPLDQANLRALRWLAGFGCPIGYSDHTGGLAAPLHAITLGAEVIEMHVRLASCPKTNPDYAVSHLPTDLKDFVWAARKLQQMLGPGAKVPQACEVELRAQMLQTLEAVQ